MAWGWCCQIRELRAEVDRRDEELGRAAQSQKAATLMELVIEKEEYLAEVSTPPARHHQAGGGRTARRAVG